ncbi:MAG: hypothetical protein V7K48_18945 [Nostoc sp.]
MSNLKIIFQLSLLLGTVIPIIFLTLFIHIEHLTLGMEVVKSA